MEFPKSNSSPGSILPKEVTTPKMEGVSLIWAFDFGLVPLTTLTSLWGPITYSRGLLSNPEAVVVRVGDFSVPEGSRLLWEREAAGLKRWALVF